jgi:hypothetical protein
MCTYCAAGKFSGATGATSDTTCVDCVAGKYSTTIGATTVDTCDGICPFRTFSTGGAGTSDCTPCDPDSAPLVAEGATSCPQCPNGLVSESGLNCVLGTACASDEYEEGGDCKPCNNFISGLIVACSLMSFVGTTFYVNKVATSRVKMVRLKVLSTFFQVQELTTLIDIAWPKVRSTL